MVRESTYILDLRRALGETLAGYRQQAGLSQAKLADELHYHRTAICHLDAGRHPAPRDFWQRADTLLAADGTLLKQHDALAAAKHQHTVQQLRSAQPHPAKPDDAAADDPRHEPVLCAPWTHAGTVESAVGLRGGGSRMKRRMFLSLTGPALTAPAHQWLIHEPGPLLSGLAGRRISLGLVNRLTAMIAELRRMDDVAGGGNVLTLAEQQFGWVTDLLNLASYDEPTGRALHIALAELGQLCGWGSYDAGQHGLAQRYWVAGLRAAHSADDRPFGAHILATMANQAARQGQPAVAVTFIDTALSGARGRATPALLAELHIRQAYALATLRDASACITAISEARTQVERLKPDDDPHWLYWLDSGAIAVSAGDCLLQLGRVDNAITLLNEGIVQFDESFIRDRQIYIIHLADALARPGRKFDLNAAAGLGIEAVELAESIDSHRGCDRLRDLCNKLTQYHQVSPVREFLERARGLVQAQEVTERHP